MKPEILTKLEERGFVTFSGNYNLNLIGVRKDKQIPNKFVDDFYVIYQVGSDWIVHKFPFTSLPGTYWLQNPSRVSGCAVLVHNKQYRGAYDLGLHRGNYEALVQTGAEVSVWRDNDKDIHADYDGEVETGYFGINIHRASRNHQSENVNKWSAGCQVFANPSHFSILISLVKKQIQNGKGSKCSYTLVTESLLNNPPKEKEPCPEEESKSPSKSRKRSSRSSSKPSKKLSKPKAPKAKAAPKSRKKKGSK